MRATFQPTSLFLVATLLAGCPGAPIPPAVRSAPLAAPVDSGLLALDAPEGSDGATQPIEDVVPSPDASPTVPGGGSGGGPPPAPPAADPTPVLVDLHCPDGAALKLAIDALPSGTGVAYYEGAIYKGSERVGTFNAPAVANHAGLELTGLRGGADYTVKLSAFDASNHQINLNKPAFEANGPYVMVPGGSLAATATVPLLAP